MTLMTYDVVNIVKKEFIKLIIRQTRLYKHLNKFFCNICNICCCRLGNMSTILANSNEAMCCEYISAILHASLCIVKRITNKELTLTSQLEVVGEESTGRVGYAIKAFEELICITEGKLHQVVMGF